MVKIEIASSSRKARDSSHDRKAQKNQSLRAIPPWRESVAISKTNYDTASGEGKIYFLGSHQKRGFKIIQPKESWN